MKDGETTQVLSALSLLSFSDVQKESSGPADLNFDKTFVAELKDSTVYTFTLAEANGTTYAKCSAEYTSKRLVLKDGSLEDKEAKLLARDRALDFAEKHKGWIYEISGWKAEKLTKKLADLLEDDKTDESSDKSPDDEANGDEGDSGESETDDANNK